MRTLGKVNKHKVNVVVDKLVNDFFTECIIDKSADYVMIVSKGGGFSV